MLGNKRGIVVHHTRGAVQHPLECWLQLAAMCWWKKQISDAADEGEAALQLKKKKNYLY